jgi:ADP-heptose:LPS heptosyltransferase
MTAPALLKVLIIRLSAIGDVVHTLPVAAAIRKLAPRSEITWVVEQASADLVLTNPVVDRTIIFPGKAFLSKLRGLSLTRADVRELGGFFKTLRDSKYDVAIDAQGLLKSAILTYMSGAKIRIGFARTREFADQFLTHRVDVGDYFGNERPIVELNLELAREFQKVFHIGSLEERPLPNFVLPALPPAVNSQVELWIAQLGSCLKAQCAQPQDLGDLQGIKRSSGGATPGVASIPAVAASPPAPLVPAAAASDIRTFASGAQRSLKTGEIVKDALAVVIPGTTWDSKTWPLDRWITLSQKISRELNLSLVFVGGHADINANHEIVQKLEQSCDGKVLDLTGQTSLLELIGIFAKSGLVVGADSGPVHLAAATGVPKVVGIFGSTPWRRNAPYGKQCISIYKDLTCQPCFAKVCPLKTKACMVDMGADFVFDRLVHFWRTSI